MIDAHGHVGKGGGLSDQGGKPEEFTFLGFDHYCGKTKEGYFKVKRRTNRKKQGASEPPRMLG